MSTPQSDADRANAFFLLDEVLQFFWPAALRAAAELRVADHLAAGPLPVRDLAKAVGADPGNLYRALRLLATRGVFAEDAEGRIALTPKADPLRSDAPNSVRAGVIMVTDAMFWSTSGAITDSVREGGPVFERIFGVPFFEYFSTDPATVALFHEGMASYSDSENLPVARALPLAEGTRLVEIGGGHGHLLRTVLREHQGVHGVLFDRPHVIAEHDLGELGDDTRWETAEGDFFKKVPSGDAYLMKRVLHDWSDDECVEILSRCREAMHPGGRIYAVDTVIPEGNGYDHGKVLDVLLMVAFTGRERTAAEFATLFDRAGLRLERVIPTDSVMSIAEGTRA
ncbi:methyltransferase [Glycomyces sp. NPDC049804]|uniref:methyltransferase n=1 Tax=Glycomyces sp. NPDC049804 TaxID=3154363 RepID=UPI0034429720